MRDQIQSDRHFQARPQMIFISAFRLRIQVWFGFCSQLDCDPMFLELLVGSAHVPLFTAEYPLYGVTYPVDVFPLFVKKKADRTQ